MASLMMSGIKTMSCYLVLLVLSKKFQFISGTIRVIENSCIGSFIKKYHGKWSNHMIRNHKIKRIKSSNSLFYIYVWNLFAVSLSESINSDASCNYHLNWTSVFVASWNVVLFQEKSRSNSILQRVQFCLNFEICWSICCWRPERLQ